MKMKNEIKVEDIGQKPTRRRLLAFTEGWILWDASVNHAEERAAHIELLWKLPENGHWKLVVFGATVAAPVEFTSRAELVKAVESVCLVGQSDVMALAATLPEDGLPRFLFTDLKKIPKPESEDFMPEFEEMCLAGEGLSFHCGRSVRPEIMKSMLFCCAPTPSFSRSAAGSGSFDFSAAIGSERYAEYHENEFVETSREPLSTFGLDVDTASYTTMRRYIMDEKRLPPVDAVRLEEFVNYFTYKYAEPVDDAPVAVNCELSACPWSPSHELLRVGVQAKRIPTENLPPSNLVFLLDVSGSMYGSFDMLKKSIRMLVEQLRDEDHVAIVTYAGDAALHLDSTAGRDKAKILAAVESLQCGGWTSGGAGIQLAYDQARKHFDPKANNRVILISDGDFNVGPSGPQETERLIRAERGNGIFLTVLGVGCGNYQDATMKRLSTAGKGNYAYIDNLLEAKKVLTTEFGGTMFTVAKDVKLQLEFNPGKVASYRLLGYECRKLAAQDFNDDKKDGGETGSGHTMTAFYEIVPAGSVTSVPSTDALKYQTSVPVASDDLLTVKLRYKEPQGDTSRKLEYPVKAADITLTGGPSEDYRFASAVAEFALLVEDSPHKGAASYDAILDRARGAKGADENGYRAEFIRLVETAQLLKR